MKRLSLAAISLVGLALVGTVFAPGEAGIPAEKPADVAREPIPPDLPREVREQIEQLRSNREEARVRAAQALGKMKAAAVAPEPGPWSRAPRLLPTTPAPPPGPSPRSSP